MRLKHGELEQLRNDLDAWVARKRAEGSGPRMSYKHATRMGIYRLHRGENVVAAVRYLNGFMDSHRLSNAVKRTEAENNIAEYYDWMEKETAAFIATKTRIQFSVTSDVSIGGERPRIDLLATEDGYRAILLGETDAAWASQLRMPLIQRAVATTLKRPEHLVSVGVQGLDGTNLDVTAYSKRKIDASAKELIDLAKLAARKLSR
jgi:hypothetical protein